MPLAAVRFASAVLVALTIPACSHVAPYERGALSSRGMDAQREASEGAFRAHVHDSREGATGGHGSTGGGCGCN